MHCLLWLFFLFLLVKFRSVQLLAILFKTLRFWLGLLLGRFFLFVGGFSLVVSLGLVALNFIYCSAEHVLVLALGHVHVDIDIFIVVFGPVPFLTLQVYRKYNRHASRLPIKTGQSGQVQQGQEQREYMAARSKEPFLLHKITIIMCFHY